MRPAGILELAAVCYFAAAITLFIAVDIAADDHDIHVRAVFNGPVIGLKIYLPESDVAFDIDTGLSQHVVIGLMTGERLHRKLDKGVRTTLKKAAVIRGIIVIDATNQIRLQPVKAAHIGGGQRKDFLFVEQLLKLLLHRTDRHKLLSISLYFFKRMAHKAPDVNHRK